MNGRTNGATNGRVKGRGSSAINGIRWGFTNGASKGGGIINGFVNGSGAVNGFRLSHGQRNVGSVKVGFKRKLAIVAVLAAIITVVPYAIVYSFPSDSVEIDGYFMDWLKVYKYRDTPDSENPDISLAAYAMKEEHGRSYFYISTEGNMFIGRDGGADGFYIFIDRDGDASTGYSLMGLGADALVKVIGWNTTVVTVSEMVFSHQASPQDFGGFVPNGEAKAAFYKNELEVGSSISVGENSRVVICSRHTTTPEDWSEVSFRPQGSALRIVADHNAPEVYPSALHQRALTLNISAKGGSTYVDALSFDFIGNATSFSISAVEGPRVLGTSFSNTIILDAPLVLRDGDRRSIDILVDLFGAVRTSSFGLSLNHTSGVSAESNTSWRVDPLQSGAKVGYVAEAPGRIAVDGAFADWTPRAPLRDLLGDAYSPTAMDNTSGDVDISVVKLASTLDTVSFYVSVNGTMMGGSSVPSHLVRFVYPGPPASNVTPSLPEPMYGADFAFVFIDTDGNQSTGFYVGGAERAISVAGKGNSILASKYYAYEDGAWAERGLVDAAIDSYQLEVSAPYSALGLVPGMTYRVTFMAEDWSGRQDEVPVPLPASITAGTRASTDVLINEIYNIAPPNRANGWIEIYNTGAEPIDLTGWVIYADGIVVYTFPSITLLPGELFVATDLMLGKSTNYVLSDNLGSIVDQVTTPGWVVKSYGRTGSLPYATWDTMTPTPGSINVGQVPIPEFAELAALVAIVTIMLIAIRRARRARQNRDVGGDEW